MADRFEVGEPIGGQGLISGTHLVSTVGGRTIEINSSDIEGLNSDRGDLELRDAKRRILNRIPKQQANLRNHMRRAVAMAKRVYRRADMAAERNGGVLSKSKKADYERELTEIARFSVRLMRDTTLANMESTAKTYLIGMRRGMSDKSRLSMSTVREVSERMARETYQEPTGSSGANTAQRLSALGTRIEAELLKNLDRGSRDTDKLSKHLIDPEGANRACVAKNVSRINRTEQNRALHKAVLEVSRRLGVNLFYWRLSGAHKSYGGLEVCEVLAVATGDDVLENLPRDFAGSLSGLYTESSLPKIPHPNCMCSIEPVSI